MLRPLSLLPALVVVAATAAVGAVPTEPASASPAPGPAPSAAPAEEDAPLAVALDSVSPSAIPREGRVTVVGTVTNLDDVTWSAINMYPFVSAEPLTTRAEIAEAVDSDPQVSVGDRLTDQGPYDTIDRLDPGETARFAVRVRQRDLGADEQGVYWFGVHALGETTEGRDDVATADGRARTFLPRMTGSGRQVQTAVVVPVRGAIDYDPDGSLADPEDWTSTLSDGGRLQSLVELGAAAGSRPVSWLVDPAVPDAVARLAAGNPGRSLAPSLDPDATEDPDAAAVDPGSSASPSPSPSEPVPPVTLEPDDGEESEESGDAPAEEPDPADLAAAEAATGWLDLFRDALGSGEALALPYGDLDVAAAAQHDPGAYLRARERSGSALQPGDVATTPALGSPAGYLDERAIRMVSDEETIVVSDEMLAALGPDVPAVVTFAGHRLVVAASDVATGGPGPDDPLATVALRQRVLAEAAVRRLETPRAPLVVVLPTGWIPDDPEEFFGGLDHDWLDLDTLTDVAETRATPVDAEELLYPESQVRRELDEAAFAAATALTEAGRTLQNLLTRNDTVGREVSDQAMTSLSYAARIDPRAVRAETEAATAEIERQLRDVSVSAPDKVILSSASGQFSALLENSLDESVTVRIQAVADESMTITMPDEDITLPPGGRRTVLLTAATEQQGVHNVTLRVTDIAGTPLGSSDRLPIRAAQVSGVIWLIIATGCALLFGAIAVRLVRRLRAARRTPQAEPTDHADAPDTSQEHAPA
ncbi:DUF6049 family protein [Nocardioides dongkuii]|uniref:DUF6049 family protein n=1 Tax=Nocardioides dongkuii TaxID=2760089 RepID=UPI0018778B3C|nr:DUF6049 family protein [Nocardioides dongkuii]